MIEEKYLTKEERTIAEAGAAWLSEGQLSVLFSSLSQARERLEVVKEQVENLWWKRWGCCHIEYIEECQGCALRPIRDAVLEGSK